MFVIFFWKEQMWLCGSCDLWAFVGVHRSVEMSTHTHTHLEKHTKLSEQIQSATKDHFKTGINILID